jgi:hypothetical protein
MPLRCSTCPRTGARAADERARSLTARPGFEQCKRVLETGEIIRYESRFAERDLVVTLFVAGKDSVISSAQDVTEQRRLQAALEQSDRLKGRIPRHARARAAQSGRARSPLRRNCVAAGAA